MVAERGVATTPIVENLDVIEQIGDRFLPCRVAATVHPAIIHWEVKHLSTAQREDCFDRHGYRFASSGGEDVMAVLL